MINYINEFYIQPPREDIEINNIEPSFEENNEVGKEDWVLQQVDQRKVEKIIFSTNWQIDDREDYVA